MEPARRLRVLRREPRALHGRAAEDLRYIRETMERSGTFTAVPGRGSVAIGVIACGAAAAASAQDGVGAWVAVWLAAAAVSVAVGLLTLFLKSRHTRASVLHGVGAKFVRSLCPPLVAGALLTYALWRAGATDALPGTWLLLYGTGLMTAGAFSARVVRVMGACFMGLSAAALVLPFPVAPDLLMAAGFGGLHVGFGIVIWRRHGG